MDRHDLLRQIDIVTNMLESISSDDAWRPDLAVVASKLKVLTRMTRKVIDVPKEAQDLLRTLRRLRNRWNELYFGRMDDEESQLAVVPSYRRDGAPSKWNDQEVAEFLNLLSDDLAMKLFCVFGRVHPKVRIDGRWCALGGGLGQEIVCDAAALCEEYQMVTADQAWILAEDAMLLAAETGVHTAELSWICEAAAPSIHCLLADGEPDVVMWRVLGKMLEEGMLHTGSPFDRPSQQPVVCVFHLTAAGVRRAEEARTRWLKCSLQRQGQQDSAPADDIPF